MKEAKGVRHEGREKNMKKENHSLAAGNSFSGKCFACRRAADRESPRIGFLDNSTASGSAVLLEAFRQETEQAWMD